MGLWYGCSVVLVNGCVLLVGQWMEQLMQTWSLWSPKTTMCFLNGWFISMCVFLETLVTSAAFRVRLLCFPPGCSLCSFMCSLCSQWTKASNRAATDWCSWAGGCLEAGLCKLISQCCTYDRREKSSGKTPFAMRAAVRTSWFSLQQRTCRSEKEEDSGSFVALIRTEWWQAVAKVGRILCQSFTSCLTSAVQQRRDVTSPVSACLHGMTSFSGSHDISNYCWFNIVPS